MEEIKEIVFTACCSFIVGEIIYYLTPKDKIINCIYALLYTVIIIYVIASISGVELEFLDNITVENKYQDEIDEQISQYYTLETEKEMQAIIYEALDVLMIDYESIDIILSASDESITIYSINVILTYKSDVDNAKIVLNKLFENEIPLEVTGEN